MPLLTDEKLKEAIATVLGLQSDEVVDVTPTGYEVRVRIQGSGVVVEHSRLVTLA